MANANWQLVENACQRDWRQSVQDIECELNGAKCKVFVPPKTSGEYDTNSKEVMWTVERFEKGMQVLDMSGEIASDESTLKEDFELAKQRAEAFSRCWDAPERTDPFFSKWEKYGAFVGWINSRDDLQWKANVPRVYCKVSGVEGWVKAEKDNDGLKRIVWVVSVWESCSQGLIWALRVRGTIYTSVFSLFSDYELGKRMANEFALCWVEGKKK